MRAANTSVVAKPASNRMTFTMLWITSADTTSSANDNAISATTSPRERRPIFRLVEPRPSSLSSGATSAREARSAGTRPATSAAKTVMAVTKSSTVRSMRTSIQKGGFVSAMPRVNIVVPAQAMSSPRTAPIVASTSTSPSVWRTTWTRVAPSAVRTATSRVRSAARASTRLATLTQAMTSTISTATSIMVRSCTVSVPTNSST